MEERFEALIHSRAWNELTEQEKEFVQLHVQSEEEYEALRNITLRLGEAEKSSILPAAEVVVKLKRHFRSTGRKPAFFVALFRWRMPAYATALLVVISVSVTGWLTRPVPVAQPTAEVVVKIDTVFVQRPADTVFVNRVVYKYVTPPAAPAGTVSLVKTGDELGVSMKEKEELENLLVSGSD